MCETSVVVEIDPYGDDEFDTEYIDELKCLYEVCVNKAKKITKQDDWYATFLMEVEGFGWRKLNGGKILSGDREDFVNEIIPDYDHTIYIQPNHEGDVVELRFSYHDGSDRRTIIPFMVGIWDKKRYKLVTARRVSNKPDHSAIWPRLKGPAIWNNPEDAHIDAQHLGLDLPDGYELCILDERLKPIMVHNRKKMEEEFLSPYTYWSFD